MNPLMVNNNDINSSAKLNDEIDLVQLFNILYKGKVFIIVFTLFFSLIAVIYSLSLPNIYQSTALLSPVAKNSSNNSNNIGGLASLAGINIQQSAGVEQEAVKKINTLSFFTDNILPNIYLPDLMALESWEPSTNSLVYSSKLYNDNTNSWVRSVSYPKTRVPSPQESFKMFKKHITVTVDATNGFTTISIKHKSPFIAKAWTELIVKEINEFFRIKDKLEAQASMDFLNAQISQTSYTEIKQVIAALLKQKMQQMTLIEANEFYVYSYIDPPIVMEEKKEPIRSSISILGAIIGAMLGIILVIIRHYLIAKKNV